MEPQLIVYGTEWCWQATRTAQFLDEHDITYTWIDIDDSEEAAARVVELNDGYRSVPTLVFEDGSTLTEPSLTQLAERLNLQT